MKRFLKSVISVIVLISTFAYISPVYAIANKETMYSKLDSTGKQYKTIVTTKEDEKVEQKTTDKELPVETKIKYELDGKEISAKDLAGKSGKVKITIKFENKSDKKVKINGKEQKIYTPFMIAVGTMIDGKNNKNVKVSEGAKIIENGEKIFVVGTAFPGLEESLDLTGKLAKINIPNSIEITMETKDFKMSNVVTYATPKLLKEDIDWNEFDDLFDKVNELKTGTQQIEDGANKLKNGTKDLSDGAKKLAKGTKTAYDGSKEIKKQISESVKKLNKDKSKALDSNTLKEIGKKASSSALESLKKQLNTIGESAKNTAVKSVEVNTAKIEKQASDGAKDAINKQIDTIKSSARDGAVKGIKGQEEGLFKQVSTSISKALSSKIDALVSGISTGVTSAMGTNLTAIENGAVTAGTSKIDLSALDKSKTVGTVNVSIGTDYKDDADYAKLDDETKALVDKLVKKVENKAEDKAKVAAQNAVNDYIKDEKEKIKNIAKQSAKVAATATSKGLESGVIKATAEASVKETVKQISAQVNDDATKQKVSKKLGELAGTVAESTAESVAKKIAPTVAASTATSTAKQVAGEAAEKTAKEVAKKVTESVSGNTATGVADSVANEVKKTATNTVKTQMETLLNKGISPLTEGLEKLKEGTETLEGGTEKLNSGATELAKGIHKFNVEGITKISNFVSVDLKNVISRGKKLVEMANEFDKFASDDKREEIGFVSVIDGIKNEDE